MRFDSFFGAVLVAALVSGCVRAEGEGESEPAPQAPEATGEERSPFDASLFKFTVFLPDDHQGAAGGSQRAVATLHFVDARESWLNPNVWDCRVVIEMPIRHHAIGVITPEHAAEMSAAAVEAGSSLVMRSQPKWIAALFCPKFARETMQALNSLNLGARVLSL